MTYQVAIGQGATVFHRNLWADNCLTPTFPYACFSGPDPSGACCACCVDLWAQKGAGLGAVCACLAAQHSVALQTHAGGGRACACCWAGPSWRAAANACLHPPARPAEGGAYTSTENGEMSDATCINVRHSQVRAALFSLRRRLDWSHSTAAAIRNRTRSQAEPARCPASPAAARRRRPPSWPGRLLAAAAPGKP